VKPLMRLLLVVASVALLPASVIAGPAAASKGGQKVDVAVCKDSVETGDAFRNRGQCVSSAPRDVVIEPGPQIFTATVDNSGAYNCSSPATDLCWGVLKVSGLDPGSVVHVIGSGPGFNGTHATVLADGSLDVGLNLPGNVHDVFIGGMADGTPIGKIGPFDPPTSSGNPACPQ
jgi:hypothetical protein